MGKKPKEAKRKPKKQRTGRKHSDIKITDMYEVKGEGVIRKRKPCPRCGEGTWLSQHKNREYCGKCGYTVVEKAKTG
jgi:small subunit ribosomal protein S27Ae